MALPQHVDPYDCLRRRAVFEGVLTSAELPRLAPLLSAVSDNIVFRIAFDSDDGRRCVIDCSVTADLPLICQHCGQEMKFPIKSHSMLVIVKTDQQANELGEAYDPLLLMDEGTILLRDMIEDELLLAIPMVPRHINEDCS